MAERDGQATVPLLAPPQQAMTIGAAMRQAAIDMPPMPDGVQVVATATAQGVTVGARVQVRDVHGAVLWTQDYDGQGRRLTASVGVRF